MANTTPDIPHDPIAEQAVIGAILLNRDAIAVVAPWLEAGHFYDQRYAWTYEAMITLYAERTPPDLVSVAARLRAAGHLDGMGGIGFLSELTDRVPSSFHIEHYGKIVRAAAVRRGLILAGSRICQIAYATTDPEEAATKAQQALDGAAGSGAEDELLPISALTDELYADMERETTPGTPTDFHDYDAITGGLHPGTFVVLAARPSVGKSAYALRLLRNLAKRGLPSLFFSLEMTRKECINRLIAAEKEIDYESIRDQKLTDRELPLYVAGIGEVHGWPIYIDETAGLSIEEIRYRTLCWTAKLGQAPAVVVIDHIQLATARGQSDEYATTTAVSKKLKELSKAVGDGGTCVIGLSQLNREVEKRSDHRPNLSDLRATGAIEQDADIVAFLYREELYDPETDKKGIAEMMIRKHRGGRLGDIALRFNGPLMRFENLSKARYAEGY